MRSEFDKPSALAAAVLVFIAVGACDAQAQQVMRKGDVLSGKLNAMRVRVNGKHVRTFQLVSSPRRLPPPNGLCGLVTGPETFQIVTKDDAQAAQLKKYNGKEIAVKVEDVACAEQAGQYSDAIVSKWKVVTKR
jgi:hypothetical protein